MSQNPTSTPREDPPASGPAPDVQVPGDLSFVRTFGDCTFRYSHGIVPHREVGDPSQPIPADDEQPDVPPFRVDYIDRGNGLEIVREYFSGDPGDEQPDVAGAPV